MVAVVVGAFLGVISVYPVEHILGSYKINVECNLTQKFPIPEYKWIVGSSEEGIKETTSVKAEVLVYTINITNEGYIASSPEIQIFTRYGSGSRHLNVSDSLIQEKLVNSHPRFDVNSDNNKTQLFFGPIEAKKTHFITYMIVRPKEQSTTFEAEFQEVTKYELDESIPEQTTLRPIEKGMTYQPCSLSN